MPGDKTHVLEQEHVRFGVRLRLGEVCVEGLQCRLHRKIMQKRDGGDADTSARITQNEARYNQTVGRLTPGAISIPHHCRHRSSGGLRAVVASSQSTRSHVKRTRHARHPEMPVKAPLGFRHDIVCCRGVR